MGEVRDLNWARAVAPGVKMIGGSDEDRAAKCLAEIQATLNRWDCALDPMVIIAGGRIEAKVQVLAKPRQVGPLPGGPMAS